MRYDDHHGVVNYTMFHTYTQQPPEESNNFTNTNITHINFDGQSIWYQMNQNRPQFWKAWQTMAIVSSTMKESRLLHTLYAFNAYYYMFNNSNTVDEGVL